MGDLTKNFSFHEFTKTNHVEFIEANAEAAEHPAIIRNTRELCKTLLQPIRDHFGAAISINSGYRMPALNDAVGGSITSQHVDGEAADIRISGVSLKEIYDHVRSGKYMYGQLILEPGWIHISIPRPYQELRQNIVIS
jgi:zinc D-Ala-D-Ala carboxypeptidase